MSTISFQHIDHMNNVWEELKKVPDYSKVTGHETFLKIFDLYPNARSLFRFGADEDLLSNPRFLAHAGAMFDMLELVIEQLDNDDDDDEILRQLHLLGMRHFSYGIDKSLFSVMGKALQHALSKVLCDNFDEDKQASLLAVIGVVTREMAHGFDMKKKTVQNDKNRFNAKFDTLTTHSGDGISYAEVMDVTSSWSIAKEMEDFEDTAAETILLAIVEMEPVTRLFTDFCDIGAIKNNPILWKQAKTFVDIIDRAMMVLGPDLEPLELSLIQLGRRHAVYKNNVHFLPTVGIALFAALEKSLGDKFDQKTQISWQKIFQFMVSKLIVGMQSTS